MSDYTISEIQKTIEINSLYCIEPEYVVYFVHGLQFTSAIDVIDRALQSSSDI